MPKRNPNKLSLSWDKREEDFVTKFPKKEHGMLVNDHLVGRVLFFDLHGERPFNFREFNFIKALENRGYDPKTIKFSIELKEENKIH